ncbi:MAG: Hint domain-containing protein [Sulfitobacter sp.]
MPTYTTTGWVWSGLGVATLVPVSIFDDDANLSPYFTNDFTETVTIGGTTYTNPSAGTYELTFTPPGGSPTTEDLLLFYTGSNFIFVPLPGSAFVTGTTINSLGGWQDYTSGFSWETVVCFTRGALIKTPGGDVAVEKLRAGDLVLTQGSGAQPILWVGHKRIRFADLTPMNAARLLPVHIRAGALGGGLPLRDVMVSPQHRMLVSSPICERMFDVPSALVAAKHLTSWPGVRVADEVDTVDYFHLLLNEHEIVFVEDAPSESLFAGAEAMRSLSEDARREIEMIFPDLLSEGFDPRPAAIIPRGRFQKKLIERHRKNNKPLLCT